MISLKVMFWLQKQDIPPPARPPQEKMFAAPSLRRPSRFRQPCVCVTIFCLKSPPQALMVRHLSSEVLIETERAAKSAAASIWWASAAASALRRSPAPSTGEPSTQISVEFPWRGNRRV
ncbi:MAG: hypothetical protein Q9198_000762 [Flavoplaca austrocitrina]